MADQQVVVRSSFPLVSVLTILFVTLKLTGVITWSWWWVFAPVWISLGLGMVLLMIAIVIMIIAAASS